MKIPSDTTVNIGYNMSFADSLSNARVLKRANETLLEVNERTPFLRQINGLVLVMPQVRYTQFPKMMKKFYFKREVAGGGGGLGQDGKGYDFVIIVIVVVVVLVLSSSLFLFFCRHLHHRLRPPSPFVPLLLLVFLLLLLLLLLFLLLAVLIFHYFFFLSLPPPSWKILPEVTIRGWRNIKIQLLMPWKLLRQCPASLVLSVGD